MLSELPETFFVNHASKPYVDDCGVVIGQDIWDGAELALQSNFLGALDKFDAIVRLDCNNFEALAMHAQVLLILEEKRREAAKSGSTSHDNFSQDYLARALKSAKSAVILAPSLHYMYYACYTRARCHMLDKHYAPAAKFLGEALYLTPKSLATSSVSQAVRKTLLVVAKLLVNEADKSACDNKEHENDKNFKINNDYDASGSDRQHDDEIRQNDDRYDDNRQRDDEIRQNNDRYDDNRQHDDEIRQNNDRYDDNRQHGDEIRQNDDRYDDNQQHHRAYGERETGNNYDDSRYTENTDIRSQQNTNHERNFPGIYIPFVYANITEEMIGDIISRFEWGIVSHIDLVPLPARHGKPDVNQARVFFKEWFTTPKANAKREEYLNLRRGEIVRVVYDKTWFWKTAAITEAMCSKYASHHISNRDQNNRSNYNEDNRGRCNEDNRGRYNEDNRGRYNEDNQSNYNEDNRGRRNEDSRGRRNEDNQSNYNEYNRGRRNEDNRGRRNEDNRGRRNEDNQSNYSEYNRGRRNEYNRGRRNEENQSNYNHDNRGRRNEDSRGRRIEDNRGRYKSRGVSRSRSRNRNYSNNRGH